MLANVTTSAIATAIGVSWAYASHIRRGANKLFETSKQWLDANRVDKDGTAVLRNPPRLVWSDPPLITALFCLPFAAFFFGIYARNTVFDSGGWQTRVQQILIAIPIALTTVSAEILGLHRLFVMYERN